MNNYTKKETISNGLSLYFVCVLNENTLQNIDLNSTKNSTATTDNGIFSKDIFDSVFLMRIMLIELCCGIAIEWNISKLLLLFLIIALLLSQWIIEILKIGATFIHLHNIITTNIFSPQHAEVSRVTRTNKHYSLIIILSMCGVCNDELPLLPTSTINLIDTSSDEDDSLPSVSIETIICCVSKSWCSLPSF